MKGWFSPAAGAIALALYARTLARGLTWAHGGADGGDLLAAALTSGVPHPTGYPTYQIVLRATLAILGGDPARTGAWLSAVCASLAVALLADLARRRLVANGSEPGRAALAAFVAALAWAAAPAVWGQATVAEVYALNALACIAPLWLVQRWVETSRRRYLWAAGLVLGLGLGNHLSLALIVPGLAAWVWIRSGERRIAGRDAAAMVLGGMVGLLVYAYLPLAASGRPPVNWGDPVTAQRLLWLVTGRLYAGLPFGLPLADAPARLLGWVSEAIWQFGGPWGLLLALFGLWRLERRDRPGWRATLVIAVAFTLYGIGYNTTDSAVYLIPAWIVTALWLAFAADWLLARGRGAGLRIVSAAALLVVLPGVSLARNWHTHDLSNDREAEVFVANALSEAEPESVILTAGDRATFGLWYEVYGLRHRDDVAVLNVNLYGYDWYVRTISETHPGLLPASTASLGELIPALAAQRPVYRADELGLVLQDVTEVRSGVLVRLISTK